MEATVISVEEELQECIAQLDMMQKKSLLEMIKIVCKERRRNKATNNRRI